MSFYPLDPDALEWIALLEDSIEGRPEANDEAAAIAELEVDVEFPLLQPATPEAPAEKTPGQLWSFWPRRAAGIPGLVLLTRISADRMYGVLVCDRAWIATTEDMVIPADAVGEDSALVAMLGLGEREIEPEAFDGFIADIDARLLKAILALLGHRQKKNYHRAPLGLVSRDEVEGGDEAWPRLLRWRVAASDGEHYEYLSGPRLLSDEDPRKDARRLFHQATLHAFVPARLPVEAPAKETAFAYFRKLRQALSEIGAVIDEAFAFPNAALPSYAVGAVAAPASGFLSLVARAAARLAQAPKAKDEGEGFTAAVLLGEVRVELVVEADAEGLGMSGAAYRDGAAVGGVVVRIDVKRADHALEIVRKTEGSKGSFERIVVPILGDARYRLRISYEEHAVDIRWG